MIEKDPADQAATTAQEPDTAPGDDATSNEAEPKRRREIGGRGGLDPTRYGDWEKAGRCIDF